MSKKEQGILVGHFADDINPECDSSDALAVYSHKDGTHSAFCWSCHKSSTSYSLDGKNIVSSVREKTPEQLASERELFDTIKNDFVAISMRSRKIKSDVYDFYGVKMDTESDGTTVRAVYYPNYRNGEHVGYKIRSRIESWELAAKKNPDKIGVLKSFKGSVLDNKKGLELFGQNKFSAGGKLLIICAGQEDAIAAYHMCSLQTKFEGGYPTVSPQNGENLADIKANYEYIKSFERIVIVPDQDKAGQAFKEELCKLLPVGKTYVVSLPEGYKDCSDMWSQNANSDYSRNLVSKKFYHLVWNAERYSPAGIKALSEGWDEYINRGEDVLIPFPDSFGDINKATLGGYALGEIVSILAATSVGKSLFTKEMIYTALKETTYKIGIVSLEETLAEFVENFLSIHMNTQLNAIPYDMRDRQKEKAAFTSLCNIGCTEADDGRIFFLDHQGHCDAEELLGKIDFLINGLGCKIIILDPITLALSGQDSDQDWFNSEVLKRVKKGTGVAWVNIAHVRKSGQGGTANSTGNLINEEDYKGSGSGIQTSMINILLSRNKLHENPVIKNTTTIRASKIRRNGKGTGLVGYAYYNSETGRLEKGNDPAMYEELEFDNKDEELPDKPLNSFGSNERKQKDPWD